MDKETRSLAGAVGKQLSVYASKTKAEALALGDSQPSAMCFPTDGDSIVFGGKEFGGDKLTDWQKDYLAKQEEEATKAKYTIVMSLSPNATFVRGTSTQVKVTVTTKFDGVNVDVQTLTGSNKLQGFSGFADTPTATQFKKETTGVYSTTMAITEAATFAVTGIYNGISKNAQQSIQAYCLIRHGVSTNASLDATGIKALTSKGPQASAAGDYTWTFTANSYAYLCIPTGVTVPNSLKQTPPQGVEGPLPVLFTKLTAVTVDGVAYDVFRIADPQGVSTHTVKFN